MSWYAYAQHVGHTVDACDAQLRRRRRQYVPLPEYHPHFGAKMLNIRGMAPPLCSQHLKLTKNSSLAIAIGYMDITATLGGISLMQTGKEMEPMLIVMGVYLVISLLISSFMNWCNHRIKLTER